MRRSLAAVLSVLLAAPAPAQLVAASAPRPVISAPVVPVVSLPFSPASALAAPVLVPALAAAAPSLAVPVPLALAVPAALPAPAAAAPAAAAPAAAIAQLGFAERLPAASAFDGSAPKPEAVEPVRAPGGGPNLSKPKTAYGALKKGLVLGVAGAASAPVLWGALPLHGLAFTLGVPAAVLLAAWVLRLAWRLARRAAGRPAAKPAAASPKKRLRALVLGLLMGATLAAGALAEKPRLVELGARVFAPELQVRRIEGKPMPDAIKAILSRNPVGREILRELEDRGGRVRLPDLFVVNRDDSAIGTYVSVVDGLFIDVSVAGSQGGTIEEFLADPAKQKAVADAYQSLMVHELRHANQYRRRVAPWQFRSIIQVEHEAYMTEHLYAHERFKADPSQDPDGGLWLYRRILEDPAGYMDGIQDRSLYESNVLSGAAYWKAWRERLLAAWPAHQVEGYVLLAKRAEKSDPAQARSDLEKARAIAKANGLPEPDLGPR